MHEHTLEGCNARPLASYLKSLGVFRIITEQKDFQAKTWWERGAFRLRTVLSKDQLEYFFCEDYAPTPIVSPWNGASGFYPTTKCEGMDSILDSELRRFSVYRNVISSINPGLSCRLRFRLSEAWRGSYRTQWRGCARAIE